MTTHENLERRYYLTRQLVEQQIKRKELLEKFCLASKHPMLAVYSISNWKKFLNVFLKDAKAIDIAIDFLKRQLAEAGGGFR